MWIDDQIIQQCHKQLAIEIFCPLKPIVVCGNANEPSRESNLSRCAELGIPVVKRCGGGGTVLLDSNSLVFSVGTWVVSPFDNKKYFQLLNQAVVDTLGLFDVRLKDLTQAGLSDIVFGTRKIAGTSLFRSRQYLLYQASLLLDLSLDLIEQTLLYPSKEPDYRNGRSHRDFLIGIVDIIGSYDRSTLIGFCQAEFAGVLERLIKSEQTLPSVDHCAHLLKRVQRSQL